VGERRGVAIVIGRCARNRGAFGIRFELSGGQWTSTWASPLKEGAANREGHDKSEITGNIVIGSSYPGCPYCRATSWVTCGTCSKLACWDGDFHRVTCPWCGTESEVAGEIRGLIGDLDL
jgi:hypothetical protein